MDLQTFSVAISSVEYKHGSKNRATPNKALIHSTRTVQVKKRTYRGVRVNARDARGSEWVFVLFFSSEPLSCHLLTFISLKPDLFCCSQQFALSRGLREVKSTVWGGKK